MKVFTEVVNKICPVEQEALDEMVTGLRLKIYRKGDYLLKADETCQGFYFIEKGLVKLFFDNGDRNYIMTFFHENMFFTELSSYITGKPHRYMLVASEPLEIHYLPKEIIESLRKRFHSVETLFCRLYAAGTVSMMKRISEMLEDDGKKKYNSFLEQRSELVQRISLGDLADYIGITQVSLSRIRTQK